MTQYESATDREGEVKFATFYERTRGIILRKLPKRYVADFAAFTPDDPGTLVGFVEYKQRKRSRLERSDFRVSLNKVREVLELRDWLALALDPGVHGKVDPRVKELFFELWVKFKDGVGFIDNPRNMDRIVWGGRFDRGDPEDVELLASYDMSRFDWIKLK